MKYVHGGKADQGQRLLLHVAVLHCLLQCSEETTSVASVAKSTDAEQCNYLEWNGSTGFQTGRHKLLTLVFVLHQFRFQHNHKHNLVVKPTLECTVLQCVPLSTCCMTA